VPEVIEWHNQTGDCFMTKMLSLPLALGVATLVGFAFFCVKPPISFAQLQTDFNIPSLQPPPPGHMGPSEADKRLQGQIIKDDAKRNTEDADKLLAMAVELRAEVAKSNTRVVSVKASKDAQQIEKLAKSIRGRLNRDYKDIRFPPIGQAQ
jgi:hypothetical protein